MKRWLRSIPHLHLRVGVLLVFALLLAIEPIIHNHPLIPEGGESGNFASSSNLCIACVVGTDRTLLAVIAAIVPQLVAIAFVFAMGVVVVERATVARASRAPPAA